jgi:hypothetical protein
MHQNPAESKADRALAYDRLAGAIRIVGASAAELS